MDKILNDLIPGTKDWSCQFKLQRKKIAENNSYGFVSLYLSEYVLLYDKHLPMHNLYSSDGEMIGVLIGTVIDNENNLLVKDKITTEFELLDKDFYRKIESFVYKYCGSWVLIIDNQYYKRLYLDSAGTLSIVYDKGKEQIASTTGLLLSDAEYNSRFKLDEHEFFDVHGSGWFSSGLTAHTGVSRLLCNHYLDLNTWDVNRAWPIFETDTYNKVDYSKKIIQLVRGCILTLIKNGRVVCSLTGGNETRYLLAACKPFVDQIDFVTIDVPGSERDVYIAKKIAKRFGLNHKVLPYVKATEEERGMWLYKASHCIGGGNQYGSPSVRPLKKYDFFLVGLGGEVGRGFFWRKQDNSASKIDATDFIARIGLKVNDELLIKVKEWSASLPEFDTFTKLDLAYTELRLSPWGFAQSYAAQNINKVKQINPLVSRAIFESMLGLTAEERRASSWITDGINSEWPELLELPVNKYGNYRDFFSVFKKLKNISRVKTKLRKLGL